MPLLETGAVLVANALRSLGVDRAQEDGIMGQRGGQEGIFLNGIQGLEGFVRVNGALHRCVR